MSVKIQVTWENNGVESYYTAKELLDGFLEALYVVAGQKTDSIRVRLAKNMLSDVRSGKALLVPWEQSAHGDGYMKYVADQVFMSWVAKQCRETWEPDSIEYQELWWNTTYGASLLEGEFRFTTFGTVLIDRQERKGYLIDGKICELFETYQRNKLFSEVTCA
jgi:hypothetical protein